MVITLIIINCVLAVLLYNRCAAVSKLDHISRTLAAMVHYNVRNAGSDEEKIHEFSKLYDNAKKWNESRS